MTAGKAKGKVAHIGKRIIPDGTGVQGKDCGDCIIRRTVTRPTIRNGQRKNASCPSQSASSSLTQITLAHRHLFVKSRLSELEADNGQKYGDALRNRRRPLRHSPVAICDTRRQSDHVPSGRSSGECP